MADKQKIFFKDFFRGYSYTSIFVEMIKEIGKKMFILLTISRKQSIAAMKSYIQELERAGHNIFRVRHIEKGMHPHCLLPTSANIPHSHSQTGAK